MLFVCDALETTSCFRTLSLSLSHSLSLVEWGNSCLQRSKEKGGRGGATEKKN